MKVVINVCFGGFGLSEAAIERYAQLKGITLYPEKGKYENTLLFKLPPDQREGKAYNNLVFSEYSIARNDPALIQAVEELGEKANGNSAELKIVEIPDDVEWHIEEYDGNEHVAENHETWS